MAHVPFGSEDFEGMMTRKDLAAYLLGAIYGFMIAVGAVAGYVVGLALR